MWEKAFEPKAPSHALPKGGDFAASGVALARLARVCCSRSMRLDCAVVLFGNLARKDNHPLLAAVGYGPPDTFLQR